MVPVSMIKVYELICDISGVKLNSLSVNSLFLFMLVYIDSTEGLLCSGRVYIQTPCHNCVASKQLSVAKRSCDKCILNPLSALALTSN